jgi:hypothetical protein
MQQKIRVADRISWQRSYDDERVFGHVIQVIPGFIVALSDRGVRFALRTREATKGGP